MTKDTQIGTPTEAFLSRSAEETRRLGADLLDRLSPGAVVAVHGDLGVGKSTLVQGMAEGLGADAWQGSPSFALVHEYATDPPLYHVDLYRLEPEEARQLGLEEYAGDDRLLVVEWADRAPDLISELAGGRQVDVAIRRLGDTERLITVSYEP